MTVPLFLVAVVLRGAEAPRLRLPDTVRPVHYAVDLKINPAAEDFTGSVDIDLDVRKPVSVVWMNGRDIRVDSAAIGRHPVKPVYSGQFLGFETAQTLPAGKTTLHASFSGKIQTGSSAGIFKNDYNGDSYVASQFEATDARRAFPCFDEPGFKVPWQLTLHVPQQDHAFSNTPIEKETRDGSGMKTVRFAETKPLPSYLVALAVGPYEIVDAGRAGKRHTPIRIITLKGQRDWTKWAVEATPPLFEALENYFGIPYPYEKLDNLAVPLFLGAMENPGLITYMQTMLVAKPGEDSLSQRRTYATVAAHEMAHQWFGDLVTLAWWNDTWLNEAFATWMEQKIVADWKPEWNMEAGDAASAQGAMRADSLVSARRIRQPIASENDIENAFDTITYNKGAAVIHMFENWAGPEKFRKGIQQYLNKYAYGNATAADFLSTVSAAAGKDLAAPFSTFLDQPGVPLVSAGLKCGSGGPVLELRQKRYLPLGSTAPAAESWQIPVCVRYGDGTDTRRECALLSSPSQEVRLEGKSCPGSLLLNDGANGYYRSLYGGNLQSSLLKAASRLSAPERVSVVGDMQALVDSGELPGGDGLRIAGTFANDPAREVVSETIAIVQNIDRRAVPEDLRPEYVRFVENKFGPRAHELGWEPKPSEDDNTRLLRTVLVPFVAVKGEDAALEKQAEELARKWLADRKAIPAELASPVLEAAARNGGRPLWDAFYREARASKSERERGLLLRAMASFREPTIIESDLNLFLKSEFDYREAIPLLFSGTGEAGTRDLAFEFVKKHYDEIAAKLPSSIGSDFRAQLPRVASGFCDEPHLAEVTGFFGPRSETALGGPRILDQVREQVRQCIAFRAAQQPSVVDFLKSVPR